MHQQTQSLLYFRVVVEERGGQIFGTKKLLWAKCNFWKHVTGNQSKQALFAKKNPSAVQ